MYHILPLQRTVEVDIGCPQKSKDINVLLGKTRVISSHKESYIETPKAARLKRMLYS